MWCSPWLNTRTDVVSLKLETRSTKGETLKNTATKLTKKILKVQIGSTKYQILHLFHKLLRKNAVNVSGF